VVTCNVDQRYLEYPIGIPLIRFEAFNGDGELEVRVLPIPHVREPAAAMNSPDAYKLLPENVGCGNDPACFADLGEKE